MTSVLLLVWWIILCIYPLYSFCNLKIFTYIVTLFLDHKHIRFAIIGSMTSFYWQNHRKSYALWSESSSTKKKKGERHLRFRFSICFFYHLWNGMILFLCIACVSVIQTLMWRQLVSLEMPDFVTHLFFKVLFSGTEGNIHKSCTSYKFRPTNNFIGSITYFD